MHVSLLRATRSHHHQSMGELAVNCTIFYNITNIGGATAPAGHTTALFVDNIKRAEDVVPVELAPGESCIRFFADYTW